MSQFIIAAGHEAVVAKSGEEALQVIETTEVGLIIMDVEMPGLDGFETTRLIREWLGDHWIPVIFVTGMSQDTSLEAGIEAGGDDYLVKPVSQMIITAKIKAMERITTMRQELKRLNDKLTQLSQRDGLTELYNRRTFDLLAAKQWKLASRHKEPLAILLIDIDHFKEYNDTYGHPAGDHCIQEIARAVSRNASRPNDIIGRYGGEEFIVLLPNTPEHGAHFIAEQIRKTVERLNLKHRSSLTHTQVTISIGGTSLNYTTGTTWAHQVTAADKALYQAKNAGRNRVMVKAFEPHGVVLVVDDDDASLALITTILKGHCTVVTTKSIEECLDYAEQLQPNMILIDVYLPGVNGYETCRSLSENEHTKDIPIVLACQTEHQKEVERFVEQAGAAGWLTKPLEEHKVIHCVNSVMGATKETL